MFPQPRLPKPPATLCSAVDIAGALSLPLPPGRSFATMRCNSSFPRLVGGARACGLSRARRPAEHGRCLPQARQALHASRLSRWAADMAPVFMVTLAYQISLDNPSVPASARVEAALELSRAGLSMIRGQVHDMRQDLDVETAEEDRLLRCYLLKSAALYGAATKMGGILTGATERDAAKLEAAGVDLGFSYQFLDDVADVVAGVAEVGKEQGMDAGKLTAVDLFGVDGARRKAREFQDRSLAQLEAFGAEADWLRTLVCQASWKAN